MTRRQDLKFAIFPAYLTQEGERTDFLMPFAERLFVWEHRRWQAVGLHAARLAQQQGAVLATESRPGQKDKGEALLALRFGPGLEGGSISTQRRGTVPAFWLGFIARSTPPRLGTPMATHCSSG